MCTPQKLQVPVQELEITLQQLNRQKARQLTGHCCNWLTCTRSRGSLWDTMHTVTRNWVRHVQLKAVLSTFLKNWHQTGKQNARDISLSLPESWFNVGPIWNAVCTSFLDNLLMSSVSHDEKKRSRAETRAHFGTLDWTSCKYKRYDELNT